MDGQAGNRENRNKPKSLGDIMLKPAMKVKPRRKRTSSADWNEYEREKRKLMTMALSPDEYERRIAEIVKRLGV